MFDEDRDGMISVKEMRRLVQRVGGSMSEAQARAIMLKVDTDNNGLTTAALSQWTSEQLIIVDDWCMIGGTDTNFPLTNQFGLTSAQTPDFQEVADTRWMVVCFNDAILIINLGDDHVINLGEI